MVRTNYRLGTLSLLEKSRDRAEEAAHQILSKYDSSTSRVIHLRDLSTKLQPISADIGSYFGEAIDCLEYNFRRSAVVFSWAGFIRIFVENLYKNQKIQLRALRSKWSFHDVQELLEYPESQLLDAGKDLN